MVHALLTKITYAQEASLDKTVRRRWDPAVTVS